MSILPIIVCTSCHKPFLGARAYVIRSDGPPLEGNDAVSILCEACWTALSETPA